MYFVYHVYTTDYELSKAYIEKGFDNLDEAREYMHKMEKVYSMIESTRKHTFYIKASHSN